MSLPSELYSRNTFVFRRPHHLPSDSSLKVKFPLRQDTQTPRMNSARISHKCLAVFMATGAVPSDLRIKIATSFPKVAASRLAIISALNWPMFSRGSLNIQLGPCDSVYIILGHLWDKFIIVCEVTGDHGLPLTVKIHVESLVNKCQSY